MFVTKKGVQVEIPGKQPQVGEMAPEFTLKDQFDQVFTLASFAGKPTILSIVPDIDTRVCAIQTKRFNVEAAGHEELNFATISNNTKEEQAEWCGQEGVKMTMLHDPEGTFGAAYNLMIPELGRYARAIFVLDALGKIQYEEIVPEISQEPDYQQALSEALKLV